MNFYTKKNVNTNKSNWGWSHNDSEDIVVAIEPSLTVRANVEDLGEFELLVVVHDESSWDENQKTSFDWSWLNILVINAVYDLLESKWLDSYFAQLLTSVLFDRIEW